jgi:hypothetical protein
MLLQACAADLYVISTGVADHSSFLSSIQGSKHGHTYDYHDQSMIRQPAKQTKSAAIIITVLVTTF